MLVRANPLGWGLFELLLSSQMNTIDSQLPLAIDGVGGGTYFTTTNILLDGRPSGVGTILTASAAFDSTAIEASSDAGSQDGSPPAVPCINIFGSTNTSLVAASQGGLCIQGVGGNGVYGGDGASFTGGNTTSVAGTNIGGIGLVAKGGNGDGTVLSIGGAGITTTGGDESANSDPLGAAGSGINATGGTYLSPNGDGVAGSGVNGQGGNNTSTGLGGTGVFGVGGSTADTSTVSGAAGGIFIGGNHVGVGPGLRAGVGVIAAPGTTNTLPGIGALVAGDNTQVAPVIGVPSVPGNGVGLFVVGGQLGGQAIVASTANTADSVVEIERSLALNLLPVVSLRSTAGGSGNMIGIVNDGGYAITIDHTPTSVPTQAAINVLCKAQSVGLRVTDDGLAHAGGIWISGRRDQGAGEGPLGCSRLQPADNCAHMYWVQHSSSFSTQRSNMVTGGQMAWFNGDEHIRLRDDNQWRRNSTDRSPETALAWWTGDIDGGTVTTDSDYNINTVVGAATYIEFTLPAAAAVANVNDLVVQVTSRDPVVANTFTFYHVVQTAGTTFRVYPMIQNNGTTTPGTPLANAFEFMVTVYGRMSNENDADCTTDE